MCFVTCACPLCDSVCVCVCVYLGLCVAVRGEDRLKPEMLSLGSAFVFLSFDAACFQVLEVIELGFVSWLI